jgi:hypothetical protein
MNEQETRRAVEAGIVDAFRLHLQGCCHSGGCSRAPHVKFLCHC